MTLESKIETKIYCPICANDSIQYYKDSTLDLRRCSVCDHCFSNATFDLDKVYSSSYFDEQHKSWFANPDYKYYAKITSYIDKLPENKSLIDIGCGNGNFLKFYRSTNSTISLTGVDVAENFSTKDIVYFKSDIFDFKTNDKFDIVTCFGVIEHIPDADKTIQLLKNLCNKNGHIIIMTMNEDSILYRTARFLRYFGYSSPFLRLYSLHHQNHYSCTSLSRLLIKHKLKIMHQIAHNIPLKSLDIEGRNEMVKVIHRVGVWATFLIGKVFNKTYLQTIIAKNEEP